MEWIWMGGPLLLIELNLTRGLGETEMGTETRTVIGDVIVIGVGIVTVVVDVDLVGTVSNVESLGILLGNALLEKGLEEVDMVEEMTSMEAAVAMALIVMAIGMVGGAETLVVVEDQGMISIVVTDLDLMSVLRQVAFVHDGCSREGLPVWRASTRSMLSYFDITSAELLFCYMRLLSQQWSHAICLFSTKFVKLCPGSLHFGMLPSLFD